MVTMAQQIGSCDSCRRGIFAAEGVVNACECDDGVFPALLLREQFRNGSLKLPTSMARTASTPSRPKGHELPALDPEMLMSPSARAELRAASTYLPRAQPPSPLRGHPVVAAVIDELAFFEAHEPYVAEDFFNVEFDTGDIEVDDSVPMRTSTREQVRFRVDRGGPEPRPFNAARAEGPQGGPMREITRVGRFPLIADREPRVNVEQEVSRYRQGRDLIAEARARVEDRTSRVPSAPPSPPVDRRNIPTAYQKLAAGNILPDDFLVRLAGPCLNPLPLVVEENLNGLGQVPAKGHGGLVVGQAGSMNVVDHCVDLRIEIQVRRARILAELRRKLKNCPRLVAVFSRFELLIGHQYFLRKRLWVHLSAVRARFVVICGHGLVLFGVAGVYDSIPGSARRPQRPT